MTQAVIYLCFISKKHVSACFQREGKAKGTTGTPVCDKYKDQCLSRLVPAPSPTPPWPSHASDAYIPCSCPQPYWKCSFRVWLPGKVAKELPSDACWIWNWIICPLENFPEIVSSRLTLQPLIGKCARACLNLPSAGFHSRLSEQVCVAIV